MKIINLLILFSFFTSILSLSLLIADDDILESDSIKYDFCLRECITKEQNKKKEVSVAIEYCTKQKDDCMATKEQSAEAYETRTKREKNRKFPNLLSGLAGGLEYDQILWNKYASCMKRICSDYSSTIRVYTE